jgi:hypothetical protein
MLLHAHSYLRPSGYLYLVLPLSCLTNSRYLSPALFRKILASTGWDVAKQHDSAKLTYWLLKRSGKDWDGKGWKRESVREGAQRNNFVIVVKQGEGYVQTEEEKKEEEVKDAKVVEQEAKVGEAEDVEMGEGEGEAKVEVKQTTAASAPAAPAPKDVKKKPAATKIVFEDDSAATGGEEASTKAAEADAPKALGKNAKKKAAKAAAAAAAALAAAGGAVESAVEQVTEVVAPADQKEGETETAMEE